jgi:hypothetical protein
VRLSGDECWDRLRSADHGILSTAADGQWIDAVPICFAVVGNAVVSPIDLVKPKSTTDLGRVRNLRRQPGATLLCEHWESEDWSQLWWVRTRLLFGGDQPSTPEVLEEALRAKYPNYTTTRFAGLLVFDVVNITGWSAEPG